MLRLRDLLDPPRNEDDWEQRYKELLGEWTGEHDRANRLEIALRHERTRTLTLQQALNERTQ